MAQIPAFHTAMFCVLLASCGGGGGGPGAGVSTTTPTSASAEETDEPIALASLQAPANFGFDSFRQVTVNIEVPEQQTQGGHVFLKVYAEDDQDDVLYLGEVRGQSRVRLPVVLPAGVTYLSYQLYSEDQTQVAGTVDLVDAASQIAEGGSI